MNNRLLYIVLFVQGFFALSLFYIGARVRENRKLDYLEMTHRVTAGHASLDDFEKLKVLLPIDSDADRVRALLGLPVQTATELEIAAEKGKPRAGKFWIYYPVGDAEKPIDMEAAEKLTGAVRCFAVEFTDKGARGDLVEAVHPLKP